MIQNISETKGSVVEMSHESITEDPGNSNNNTAQAYSSLLKPPRTVHGYQKHLGKVQNKTM